MREIRTSGSEGGAALAVPTPIKGTPFSIKYRDLTEQAHMR
jgi:hypothetical protein